MNDKMSDRVFERAAEMFSLLSTPTRLHILYELCQGEKNVSELLTQVGASQSNVSQHLGTLYRGGVLGRRRAGGHVFYRIVSEQALMLCESICAERDRRIASGHRA